MVVKFQGNAGGIAGISKIGRRFKKVIKWGEMRILHTAEIEKHIVCRITLGKIESSHVRFVGEWRCRWKNYSLILMKIFNVLKISAMNSNI